ncbi:uracil-DNA glycosylase family protein [Methylosinus sp. Sm6]|uniref:uracil-DNA glycosylase n=1 Tax=Methylosinus sp. Sm6 TaxID=2866948 RepID=UPI001C99452C|nr:uracil-DNA glycosylase [Methylosinus sp. Sm6]MBY6241829.1 uracil-DNA glycosylase [Methylosinus sp. Sm6]
MDRENLAALLDWYVAVGVDIAVDETPHDRFAESAASPPPAAPSAPRREPLAVAPTPARRGAGAPVFPEEAAREAREAAAGAGDLETLRARLADFDGCAQLKAAAAHFLFSAGAPGAPLMTLDFAPGEEDERSGAAFAGKEARLLDNMLKAIGRDRSSAYLAYATPWRPPGARELNAGEAAALQPFLRRHVELAAPKILLLLGDYAARAALGATDVAKLRGQWFDYDAGAARPRALLAPSLDGLLKTPALKRRAWRELRAVAAALS